MSPRIFIVDDIEACRDLIKEMLTCEGYSNLRLFSHPNAVIEAVQNGDRPRLVITDFDIPCLDGLSLLDHLESLLPSVSGILVSSDIYTVLERSDCFPVVEKSGPDFYNRLLDTLKKSL